MRLRFWRQRDRVAVPRPAPVREPTPAWRSLPETVRALTDPPPVTITAPDHVLRIAEPARWLHRPGPLMSPTPPAGVIRGLAVTASRAHTPTTPDTVDGVAAARPPVELGHPRRGAARAARGAAEPENLTRAVGPYVGEPREASTSHRLPSWMRETYAPVDPLAALASPPRELAPAPPVHRNPGTAGRRPNLGQSRRLGLGAPIPAVPEGAREQWQPPSEDAEEAPEPERPPGVETRRTETRRTPDSVLSEEQVPGDVASAFHRELGVDVTDVPVLRGPAVGPHARKLGGRAFSRGGAVFLPDEVGPTASGEGRALLSHELAHVIQQRTLGAALPAAATAEGRDLEARAQGAELWAGGGLARLPAPLRHPHAPASPTRIRQMVEQAVSEVRNPTGLPDLSAEVQLATTLRQDLLDVVNEARLKMNESPLDPDALRLSTDDRFVDMWERIGVREGQLTRERLLDAVRRARGDDMHYTTQQLESEYADLLEVIDSRPTPTSPAVRRRGTGMTWQAPWLLTDQDSGDPVIPDRSTERGRSQFGGEMSLGMKGLLFNTAGLPFDARGAADDLAERGLWSDDGPAASSAPPGGRAPARKPWTSPAVTGTRPLGNARATRTSAAPRDTAGSSGTTDGPSFAEGYADAVPADLTVAERLRDARIGALGLLRSTVGLAGVPVAEQEAHYVEGLRLEEERARVSREDTVRATQSRAAAREVERISPDELDLTALAERLYDGIRARLRRELIVDRERSGTLADFR